MKCEDIITEFIQLAPVDGEIIIKERKIIKIKPQKYLTVDLRYDAEGKVFLDADGNVYIYKDPSSQIKNVMKNPYDLRQTISSHGIKRKRCYS